MTTQTALIWGASGGIGRALIQKLHQVGWQVIAIGRDDTGFDDLEPALALEISHIGDPYSLQQAILEVGIETDSIQLMIFAVGDITSVPVSDLDPDTWGRIIEANLTGAHLATHYSLPLVTDGAHLVYIGAVSERMRLPGLSAYAAAKAGLEAYVETLKKEQRKKKVLMVRPGAIDTPLWQKVPLKLPKNAMTPAALAEQIVQAIADGKSGSIDI